MFPMNENFYVEIFKKAFKCIPKKIKILFKEKQLRFLMEKVSHVKNNLKRCIKYNPKYSDLILHFFIEVMKKFI